MSVNDNPYIEEIRQRLGINKEDQSKDNYIENLDPLQRVQLIVGWLHGSECWAIQYKEYFESQGLYLTVNSDDDGII